MVDREGRGWRGDSEGRGWRGGREGRGLEERWRRKGIGGEIEKEGGWRVGREGRV